MMHNFWLAVIKSQASVREDTSKLAHLRMHKKKSDKQADVLFSWWVAHLRAAIS